MAKTFGSILGNIAQNINPVTELDVQNTDKNTGFGGTIGNVAQNMNPETQYIQPGTGLEPGPGKNTGFGGTIGNVASSVGAGSEGATTNEFILPSGEEVKPYSGLPESYRDLLLSFVMPQLQSSVGNMEGNIDDYTQNALGTYRSEFNQYINDAIPQQIRKLAKRGILSSSVAENTLAQTYSDALRKSSGMGYQTAMEAAKMKTAIPQTIRQLLAYGQYSEDPTVMYKTLAGLLSASMP